MKSNPLYVKAVIAGIDKKDGVFLGTTDFHGTKIDNMNFVATGLGLHYCQVLLQNSWRPDMTEAEAKALLDDCFKQMFYRDKKAHD